MVKPTRIRLLCGLCLLAWHANSSAIDARDIACPADIVERQTRSGQVRCRSAELEALGVSNRRLLAAYLADPHGDPKRILRKWGGTARAVLWFRRDPETE